MSIDTGLRARRRPPVAAAAVLAASCLMAVPASPQAPPDITCGGDTTADGDSFYESFAGTQALLQTYGYPMPRSAGASVGGDRNSAYFQMFYSIAHANSIVDSRGNPCRFELVIVGTFPDSRHFSITDNDMHYSATQHLADYEINPVSPAVGNPFQAGQPYTGMQHYLVPVALGYLSSNTSTACSIPRFEQVNLLDATQRHASVDWNTDVQHPNGGAAHKVDLPMHPIPPGTHANGSNTAGSLTIRSYLAPSACTGAPGSGAVTCTFPNPAQTPYLMVRDARTGCAYPVQTLIDNGWLDDPNATPDPVVYPATAIVSTADRAGQGYTTGWNDANQHYQHTVYSSLIPQACYANGGPDAAQFPNQVAWVRGPEWLGSQAPDDSYLGGAVSAADLRNMQPVQPGGPAQQVMRFRFQLPDLPDTPCVAPYSCTLNGTEQLRYMSLTFGYQAPGSSTLPSAPVSIVSLADSAFAITLDQTGNRYVTLLVSAGGDLPDWLKQTAHGVTAAAQGVYPPTPQFNPRKPATPGNYSVWQVNGYAVLDLSQFPAFAGVCSGATCSLPLLIGIRDTLPGAGFQCSGAAVPFGTALYTNIQGTGSNLMGPYIPLVDYLDPNLLPAQAGAPVLPSAAYCGILPDTNPGTTPLGKSVMYPTQYWPGACTGALNCTAQPAAAQPTITFVSTQRTTLAGTSSPPCTDPSDPCTQVIAQARQDQGQWQPAMPLQIIGTGFGFLPRTNLPFVAAGPSAPPFPYLEIGNDGASGKNHAPWDTNADPWQSGNDASCQIYVGNWTDTNISLILGIPAGATSPLADVSFQTLFFPFPYSTPPLPCPVQGTNGGDTLTITVTNPQLAAQGSSTPSAQKQVRVQPYNTIPN